MALPTVASVRASVDAVLGTYDASFAGQSRATRDIALLDQLIARLRAARVEIDTIPGGGKSPEVATLRETLSTTVELYTAERKLIEEARALGPAFGEFAALGGDANLVFGMYRRHFAGKNRATRDLGLLAEMIADLERIRAGMAEVSEHLPKGSDARTDMDIVAQNLKMYVTERGEIVEGRGLGTPDEQAGILAEVANGQFGVYQNHFAGKSRLTRRPGLLQRVIDNLVQVHDRMQLLRQQGLVTDSHMQNITVVENALKQYRMELGEVRKVREATPLVDIMGALGGGANEVMEAYSRNYEGQRRETRDLGLLSTLCDQMAEIGKQMADMDRAEANEMNARNLGIVTNNRVMLEREYVQIETARGGAPASV